MLDKEVDDGAYLWIRMSAMAPATDLAIAACEVSVVPLGSLRADD